MSLHPELLEQINRDFCARLRNPARLTQDALILELDNGVDLTVRYAADDAYSLRWRFAIDAAELELGIDTAPLHPTLATRPNHLHLADGRVVADPLTRPDRPPAHNVAAVLEAILASPTLTDRLA
ncbi:MAG: hypothetical protein JNK52_01580 [Zoogloeaceae bacterium]|nr:hypothetical protein [Zoogloeaceae bacterium]